MLSALLLCAAQAGELPTRDLTMLGSLVVGVGVPSAVVLPRWSRFLREADPQTLRQDGPWTGGRMWAEASLWSVALAAPTAWGTNRLLGGSGQLGWGYGAGLIALPVGIGLGGLAGYSALQRASGTAASEYRAPMVAATLLSSSTIAFGAGLGVTGSDKGREDVWSVQPLWAGSGVQLHRRW